MGAARIGSSKWYASICQPTDTSSGSRVRRDGTTATSSKENARRPRLPRPISISLLTGPAYRRAAGATAVWVGAGRVTVVAGTTGDGRRDERRRRATRTRWTMTKTPWTAGPLLGLDTGPAGVDAATGRAATAALGLRERGATRGRTGRLAPGTDIPAEATAVHGVTTAHAAAHGSAPAAALDEIATLVVDAQRDGV